MGKVYVYPASDPNQITLLDTWEKRDEYKKFYTPFKSYLSGITIEGK